MEEFRGKVVTDDDLKKFQQKISQYEWHQLGLFYEHFLEDLIYIIQSLDTQRILWELNSRKLVSVEYYASMKKECGASVFAEMLLEDIRASGRDAVLGFWESLYVLQNDHPHPNLLGVLDELTEIDELEQWILLDKQGHDLPGSLQACQLQHREFLQEKTQNLVEHRAPGLTTESQSFHISERYLDLIVVSNQHFRTYSQHELIATGGIHEHYLQRAQSNLERISPNRLFRWCHRKRCVPHTVLVSGVPGVGKTTLMQKFVYDWVSGELYQRFAFVFLFKFRDLNTMDKTSLAQMILSGYPYLHGELERIFQNPEKLLFIFDGLDESKKQVDFKSCHPCNDPQSPGDISIIVSSLVKQTLLRGCSVLITSRPTRVAEIDVDIFHRMSEIVGFFPRQREKYFKHFFQNEVVAKKAFHYVRENGILYTFCYIPAYCWIICTVLAMSFKTQGKNDPPDFSLLPKTVTQLFVAFVSNIFTNHSQDLSHAKEELMALGWLAEYGLTNQALVFEKEDVQSYITNTYSQMMSSFIVECGQPPHVSYSFFHLTVQEFLAALVHYMDCSSEKLKETLRNTRSFDDGRREIFLRFISGLSDNSTRSLLKPTLGTLSAQASKDVISFLQETVTQVWDPEGLDANKRNILNVFACLAESRNKGLVSSTIGSNQIFDFSEFYLAPLDCTVLAFILESCGETEHLDLSACFIQSEGLERLAPALHSIAVLELTKNNLRDEDMQCIYSILTNPQCRIRTLRLMKNGLTEESCILLAFAVKENNSLRELDLSKNKLAGENFYQLLKALSDPTCRIESLELQETKLIPEYTASLLSLTKNTSLTHLNISNNFFGDTGYPHIRKLILEHPSLKEIRVGMNSFSENTEKQLEQLQRPGVNIIL
ncbi:NACHT, LRR and PYD domains-containing protein 14 [Xenopus laevis]|uniref:NACHT domain-containing protein n=2 Tax=Xenopus laevis TaxID=8355 RepID=A0A974CB10_XENLA|nr:NACHT, LRR and PYD domains-containing protein 14 [Xenopus laevis]OCT69366.1 hypothetical protein XELAEV_18040681mg [Xenopus laevis]